MPYRPYDLTAFQEKILFAIASFDRQNRQNDGPRGLGVKEYMEKKFYADEINHGRLYPNLDTLVQKDLVEKGQTDRRTNWYALTADGREYCESLLLEFGNAWENVGADVDGEKVVVSNEQVGRDARSVVAKSD